MSAFFPPLDDDFLITLNYIAIALKVVTLENSPYTDDEKRRLGNLLGSVKKESPYLALDSENKEQWIETEAANLYQEAREVFDGNNILQPNEKNQNIKTRQTLLEKLASIREGAVKRQDMLSFETLVMGFLESELTPLQMESLLSEIEKEKKEYG